MTLSKQTVLITGCSTGIGRALALEFHKRGHVVYATARRVETLNDLAGMGIKTLTLDVNKPDDIHAAVKQIEENQGGVDILVNNAGFIAMGPMIDIPIDKMRIQFETNVISIVSMSQAVSTSMIQKRKGRIVNIGSVSGILPTPFAGAYCASKSAVHSLSDALRMELAPFNIKVITVQPGGIVSDLGKTAKAGIPETDNGRSVYSKISDAITDRATASQINATPVEEFANHVANGVLEENPRPVIRLGNKSRILPFIRYFLPTGARDRLLMKKFRLNELME